MSATIRRRGRPTIQATPGERAPLGLRVTAEMKRALDEAAKASGRSLSQEVEIRLEQSFLLDRTLAGIREAVRGMTEGLSQLASEVRKPRP